MLNENIATSAVKIGRVEIPFLPEFEKIVSVLLREILPKPVLLAPSLEKFGIIPSRDPTQFYKLMCQLFCFPRQMTDRSASAESGARSRVDAGQHLMTAFNSVPALSNPATSTQTQFAAAWAALYLSLSKESCDAQRIDFLQRTFGATPAMAKDALTVVSADKITLDTIPLSLGTTGMILPPLGNGVSWSDMIATESSSAAALPAVTEPIGTHTAAARTALYEALCKEICEPARLINNVCLYHRMEEFFDTPLSGVIACKRALAERTGSFVIKTHSRIVCERENDTYIVDESKTDLKLSRSFRLETPDMLAFRTPSFSQVTARTHISKNVIVLSGRSADGKEFCLVDAATPPRWCGTMEKF